MVEMGIPYGTQVRPTSSTRRILTAACCWLAFANVWSALAAESGHPASKIAVVAVVTEEGQSDTLKMAEGVYGKLSPYEQYEVLPVEDIRRLLAGTGAVGDATEDVEKLESLYQDAYLKSYSFECQDAVEKLKDVIERLRRTPDSPARWGLFVKANIYLGKSLLNQKKNKEALEAFKMVLRTRPEMNLSPKEHPVRDINLWEKARTQVKKATKGKLILDTEPSGAEVFLDGETVGFTPFIRELPNGRYHLRLHHKVTGLSYRRLVDVGEEVSRFRIDLAFESSLLTGLPQPVIRLPEGQIEVPEKWLTRLGERLGVGYLVVVEKGIEEKKTYWSSSLFDLGGGRLARKIRVEESGDTAGDMARFIATGEVPDKGVVEDKKSVSTGGEVEEKESDTKPSVDLKIVSTKTKQPWHRKWWPYAVGGAVLLGGGVAANLVANDYYDDPGGLASKRDAADTWMGLAIGGYVLAGMSIILGIVLDTTWDGDSGSSRLVPVARPGGVGVMWSVSF